MKNMTDEDRRTLSRALGLEDPRRINRQPPVRIPKTWKRAAQKIGMCPHEYTARRLAGEVWDHRKRMWVKA